MASENAAAVNLQTGVHLQYIREHGYVVLENVLSSDEVAEYTSLVYEVYHRSGKEVGVERLHSLTYYSHHQRFLDLLEFPPMLALVRQALSSNIYVYHTHLDVNPRNSVLSYHWHQDVDLISRDCEKLGAPLFLKVGYYLTDVPTEQHGATRVQPGTHAGRAFDPDDPGIPLIVPAGSAVIFDHRLWHTSGLNTSATDRLAIFVAYGYRWIRRRDEIPVFSGQLNDLGRTLRILLDELPPETT